MTDKQDNSLFRGVVGFLALGAGIAGFIALFWIEIPARNENALMFAMGIVFGWGSAVIASEYGATTTGRKVAESAIRNIERQNAAEGPSGTPDDPLSVAGADPGKKPVATKDSKP
jgi:hypothetical protein